MTLFSRSFDALCRTIQNRANKRDASFKQGVPCLHGRTMIDAFSGRAFKYWKEFSRMREKKRQTMGASLIIERASRAPGSIVKTGSHSCERVFCFAPRPLPDSRSPSINAGSACEQRAEFSLGARRDAATPGGRARFPDFIARAREFDDLSKKRPGPHQPVERRPTRDIKRRSPSQLLGNRQELSLGVSLPSGLASVVSSPSTSTCYSTHYSRVIFIAPQRGAGRATA